MKDHTKAVLFDLDGTLWDSGKSVVDAWNVILAQEDLPQISAEQMRSVMGFSMDDIWQTLFPTCEKARGKQVMKRCECFENAYTRSHGGILFEHVREVLSQMSEQYMVGIISNCQAGYIEAFLAYYGLEDYVDFTRAFGDFHKQKAENIQDIIRENKIKEAIYIGDIENDYLSAKKANVPFLLAKYGFGPFPYAPYVESVKEIPACVELYFEKGREA